MQPRAEMVHWVFASGVLVLGLIMIAQAIAGPAVWAKRPWRVYLWPAIAFGLGILMWPVMTFYTNSAIHMVAHSVWAQALMVMGAAELGLAKGKLLEPVVAPRRPDRDRVLGRGVPGARAEPLALLALGVPAPPAGLDADRGRALPARAHVPAALDVPPLRLRARS